MPVVINVATNLGYFIVMTLAWFYAKQGDLNQGIISSLLSLASVFNLISFRIFFQDKIRLFHYVGIILMLCAVVTLGFEASSKEDTKIDLEEDSLEDPQE